MPVLAPTLWHKRAMFSGVQVFSEHPLIVFTRAVASSVVIWDGLLIFIRRLSYWCWATADGHRPRWTCVATHSAM
eukprot:6334802-Pyramimonas_sp.AAC.1